MKVSLKQIAIFLIILALLVLFVGRSFPGFWIYSLILIIFGISLLVKNQGK